MEGEPTEMVRWIYSLDWADVDAKRDWLMNGDSIDPNFESLLLDKPGAGVLRGTVGMQSFGEAIEQDFVHLAYRPDHYEMVGDSQLVVSGHIEARTRTSGHRVQADFAHLWTLAGRKPRRVEAHASLAAAIEAATTLL
jgi:hypothetical protein